MTHTSATLHIHTRHQIGTVDPRIFGGFLEHMGRAVYEGVFDPSSRHADAQGCRADVLDALSRLGFTTMRYPGGNFVSNYHWQNGVGPVADRPQVRDLAWGSIEPNTFGTDEFLGLAARMDWTPMLAVNLGTGSPEEAADWVEYCNATTETVFARQRQANGRDAPWSVPLWCLGNEMDGPWQTGHMPAEDYGIKARQAGHMMKLVDPNIELVVCGSSVPTSKTWMSWDREALTAVGGLADHLSAHRYVGNPDNDTRNYLTTGALIDRQIADMDAVCGYVGGARRSKRRPTIAFDEWNVWYRTMNPQDMARGQPFPMPLIEEVYDLQDALVVGQFLNSFLRRADVVKVANLAQICNVIAPMLTKGDDLLLQTIFHALAMYRGCRAGESLVTAYEGPMVPGPFDETIDGVDCAAVLDGESLHVFAVNRLLDKTVNMVVKVADSPLARLKQAQCLRHDDPSASNTWEQPETVVTMPLEEARISAGELCFELPPLAMVSCVASFV